MNYTNIHCLTIFVWHIPKLLKRKRLKFSGYVALVLFCSYKPFKSFLKPPKTQTEKKNIKNKLSLFCLNGFFYYYQISVDAIFFFIFLYDAYHIQITTRVLKEPKWMSGRAQCFLFCLPNISAEQITIIMGWDHKKI